MPPSHAPTSRGSDSSPVPIAGAETEETIQQFARYLDVGLMVIQPDLGRCGRAGGEVTTRHGPHGGVVERVEPGGVAGCGSGTTTLLAGGVGGALAPAGLQTVQRDRLGAGR